MCYVRSPRPPRKIPLSVGRNPTAGWSHLSWPWQRHYRRGWKQGRRWWPYVQADPPASDREPNPRSAPSCPLRPTPGNVRRWRNIKPRRYPVFISNLERHIGKCDSLSNIKTTLNSKRLGPVKRNEQRIVQCSFSYLTLATTKFTTQSHSSLCYANKYGESCVVSHSSHYPAQQLESQ